jgi:hypothetical protein
VNPLINGAGNVYFDVLNVRIICLRQTWAGTPGIRIQAYKGNGSGLYQGAEIPLANQGAAYQFVKALFATFGQLGL